MATNWLRTPPNREENKLDMGPFTLFIRDEGAKRWTSVVMSLGRFTESDLTECLATWPREALTMVRAELDRVELLLNERETNETVVH